MLYGHQVPTEQQLSETIIVCIQYYDGQCSCSLLTVQSTSRVSIHKPYYRVITDRLRSLHGTAFTFLLRHTVTSATATAYYYQIKRTFFVNASLPFMSYYNVCSTASAFLKQKPGNLPFLLSFDLGNPESESPELHGTFTLNELALLWSQCLIGFSCILATKEIYWENTVRCNNCFALLSTPKTFDL